MTVRLYEHAERLGAPADQLDLSVAGAHVQLGQPAEAVPRLRRAAARRPEWYYPRAPGRGAARDRRSSAGARRVGRGPGPRAGRADGAGPRRDDRERGRRPRARAPAAANACLARVVGDAEREGYAARATRLASSVSTPDPVERDLAAWVFGVPSATATGRRPS